MHLKENFNNMIQNWNSFWALYVEPSKMDPEGQTLGGVKLFLSTESTVNISDGEIIVLFEKRILKFI